MTIKSRHILFSVLLHVILFAFLFLGVECSNKIQPPAAIQGVLINQHITQNEAKQAQQEEAIRQAEQQKQQAEIQQQQIAAQAAAKATQQAVQQKQLAAEQAEQQKQAATEKAAAQQKILAQKQAEEQARVQQAEKFKEQQAEETAEKERKAQKAKQAAEKERKAQEAKQAAEQAKLEKQQAQETAEKERKAKQAAEQAAEQAKLEKQQAKEAAEKAKEAKEAAAKAKAAKAHTMAVQAEKERLAALQEGIKSASHQVNKSMLSGWIAQIAAKMARNWQRPTGIQADLHTTVSIKIKKDGTVASVSIVKSSGNYLFDASVKRAVIASSPLPLPADMSVFDNELTPTFTPRDLGL